MARRLVICLDGTGNELESENSNVLKLFTMLDKSERQRVYYSPGVGTIARPSWWVNFSERVRSVFGLLIGFGLDDTILDAYSWLCRAWRPGDDIFLFGFSRGAYAARALAGLIHTCGLLPRDQLNLCGYGLTAYKRTSDTFDFAEIGFFRGVVQSRFATIRFLGVWDTVGSLIVPRRDLLYFPAQINLAFIRANPSVETFRQALAIDERRSMYRPERWKDPQAFRPERFRSDLKRPQDIRQVWFSGVHADIGGGYPEAESGLAKFPLAWMVGEAVQAGLEVDSFCRDVLLGIPAGTHSGYRSHFAPSAPTAPVHASLASGWWLLEAIPKFVRVREWARRPALLGAYLPWGEPRAIPNRHWRGRKPDEPAVIHSSVLARMAACPGYCPVNLPGEYQVETAAGPPAPEPAERPVPRPERAFQRVGRLSRARPSPRDWLGVPIAALALAVAFAGAALAGVASPTLYFGANLGSILLAAFLSALVGEALFRGLLLKPPAEGTTGLGAAIVSGLLFTLWPTLLAFACQSSGRCPWFRGWAGLGFEPSLLLGAFALGFACARLVLAARSIWPAVVLHGLVVAAAATLFGRPG